MERKMWPIEVDVDERGFIRISQETNSSYEDDCILLHPDQVDLLIQWINDARNESQKQ